MSKRSARYVVANIIGILLYVVAVWHIQHGINAEGRQDPDFGDSLTFIFTALPILGLSLLVNFWWGAVAVANAYRDRQYRPALVCTGVVIAWVGAILILRELS
jgi:hypothetical protein